MTTLKPSFTILGAVLLAVLMAMMPSPALAEPGVANSEVTYSADGQTFTEIGPEGFAPRSNDGVVVRPGGRPNTKTTFIRHSTTNVQNLDVVIAVRDLAELTASRGNPSDFLITIVVDGVESEEYRFGDLFADGKPYDDDPKVRRVGPAIELTGDVGEVHEVKILHRLPFESGNESQLAVFRHNLAVIPEAPSPSPTPTETETPSPTPTETDTPSPTPTDTETPSPTPTDTETPSPSPTATETETPSPSPTATETETPSPSPTATETETPSPSPTATETETPSPSPTATETDTPSPSPTGTETPSPTPTETTTESPVPTPSDTEVPTPTATATETDPPRPTDKPTDQPDPPRDDDRPGPPRDDDRKPLPRTGSDIALGLGLGLTLVGIGTAAALAGRRRRA